MINLVPPEAKKQIKVEYWVRVCTVWTVLLGATLLAIAILMIPSTILVSTKLNVLNSIPAQTGGVETTKKIEKDVKIANANANLMTEEIITLQGNEIITTLESIAGVDITIVGFSVNRDRKSFSEVLVQGIANSRAALVAYQNAITLNKLFKEATLPISNFADNKNIKFSIKVTVASGV